MSNKLTDNLTIKTMIMPGWFGLTREEVIPVQDGVWEFIVSTLIPDIVCKLLDEEPSPDYWYSADVWPYPDTDYLKAMCSAIDHYAPEEWPLHVRTYYFAWLLQHVRMEAMRLLVPIYEERLKQQ